MLRFLSGGGDMGRRMRAYPWHDTPLGPPTSWPGSLRSAVSICLNANFPTAIYWGEDLRLLYNDAWAPIPGERHPGALGRPGAEVWSDIWHIVGPQFAQVMETGEAVSTFDQMLPIVRDGRPEETYWDYSLSAIRGEDGSVVGVFNQGRETTERVLTQRRQAFRIALEEALHQTSDPRRIMATAVEALGRNLKANRVGYGEVLSDDVTVELDSSFTDGVAPVSGTYALDAFGPNSIARQRRGETQYCDDVLLDPDQNHAVWAAIETRAFVSVPFVRDGRFTASIYVNFKEPHRWTPSEIAQIEEVGARTWEAVERARAEERLRASEAKFQAIADSVDHMIWSTRADGFHDYFNQRWYDFTGVRPGTTDGDDWSALIHPDDRERLYTNWRRSLATGEPYRTEHRLRHVSGQHRWVLGRAECVRDEAGAITRWFGTCTDIHDQVEAREILARSREELEREVQRRTEDRDRVWRLSSDLMLVARFDATIVAVNPAWTNLLGWEERDLIDRRFIDLVHPDDVANTLAEAGRLAEGRTTLRFENRYQHRDGSYRWLSWTAVPDETFIHAVARDVSELHHAQEALRQAQKMEAVGQLTGGVAHDFNNLLTVIKSSTDLLRRPGLAEERRRRYVDAIAETVDRASKLTAQLLAFARRQALKPEVFDAGQRLCTIMDMLRTIVGSRVTIVTEVACPDCFIEADASQFETAIVNMVVNARDAMDNGGALHIKVRREETMPGVRGPADGAGPWVAVSLADTGHGIAPEKLGQIFEPFFTTKEVGKGTGLGLSQVYGFAKQSGGDVKVESTLGRGTTFTLYLPEAVQSAAAAQGPEEGAFHAPEEGRGRHILVVEDNREVGRFSTQLLQDLGYETTWASNADEALGLLAAANSFDAVFSDVVMPGMSGIELGQRIRLLYPGLPVVLTSGYSHILAEEGRHGFELLQKPYAAEALLKILRRVSVRKPKATAAL
jgi:PAS domain S-box-containing protein